MFSYFAYGLGIESELPLPELVAAEKAPDITIRSGIINWSPPAGNGNVTVHITPEEMYFFWQDVGTFLVRGGREIVVQSEPKAEGHVVRLFLLGAVLAGLLHQRGLLLLHASAVTVGGGAIAFIGEKGQGKSTMAASMQARRHGLIADDIVAVEINERQAIRILPGFPQFKLWPDAIASLGVDPEKLPRVHPQIEKRAYRIHADFSVTPLPLKSIYVLDEGEKLKIEKIASQEAFVELVRHSYLARHLDSTGASSSHFRQCSAVVSAVPLFRLIRPRSLNLLSDVAALVEQNLIETAN